MLTPLLNTDIVNQWAIQQPAVPWGAVMLENMKSILWQIIMTYYSGEEGIRMDISVYKESKHTKYLIPLGWLSQRYEHTVVKQSEGGAESVEEPKHTE